MKKKKFALKGFTLVEAVASIIIISIIALIAIPIVGNVTRKAKVKVAMENIKNYVYAANHAVHFNDVDDDAGLRIDNYKYIYESTVDDLGEIKVNGSSPTYSYIVYSLDTKTVSTGHFCINGISIDYAYGETEEAPQDYCNGFTMKVGDPIITYINNPTVPSNGYFKSQKLIIEYSAPSVTRNYIISTRDAEVEGCFHKCGDSITLECEASCATSLEANIWYKPDGKVNLVYSETADIEDSIEAITYLQDELKGRATAIVAKIDNEAPSVTATNAGATITIDILDDKSGGSLYCVTTSSDASTCTWNETETGHAIWTVEEVGAYYVFAKDGASNLSDPVILNITDLTAAYPATATCTNGGTYDGHGGCYYSANQSVCGCSTWKNCSDSACGVSGTTYNTCASSDCGTDTVCNTCTKNLWQYCCDGKYQGSNSTCTKSPTGYTASGPICPNGYVRNPAGSDCINGASKCYYDYTYTNNCDKCGSTTVDRTCQTSACGVAYYSYHSCRTSGCGCESAASCTKTDSTYVKYSCPDGGTLDETVCIK